MIENKERLIAVHSLKLLRELEKNRCFSLLHHISIGKEIIDGIRYPIYLFFAKPDVMEIKQKYEQEHGTDSVKLDDSNDWIGYNESYVSNSWDKNINKISTTNYYCLSRLFDEGFTCRLISVGKNTKGKRMFIFSYDSEIERIVIEEKEKSKKIFAEKHKDSVADGKG